MAHQVIHRVRFRSLPGQIAILGIALQQSSPFQDTADALGNGVGQLGKLGTARRLDPAKAGRSIGALRIRPTEKQHVEMNVHIERGAEVLDQCHRAGVGRLAGEPSVVDQVRSNDTVNDAEHPIHDHWRAGEQKTRNHGSMLATALCDRAAMDKVQVSCVVSRPVARKLFMRHREEKDRRLSRLALNAEGRLLDARIVPLATGREAQIMEVLSEAERGELGRIVEKLTRRAQTIRRGEF